LAKRRIFLRQLRRYVRYRADNDPSFVSIIFAVKVVNPASGQCDRRLLMSRQRCSKSDAPIRRSPENPRCRERSQDSFPDRFDRSETRAQRLQFCRGAAFAKDDLVESCIESMRLCGRKGGSSMGLA
jgi:hypothetical protein